MTESSSTGAALTYREKLRRYRDAKEMRPQFQQLVQERIAARQAKKAAPVKAPPLSNQNGHAKGAAPK